MKCSVKCSLVLTSGHCTQETVITDPVSKLFSFVLPSAALLRTKRLPVLYVFGQEELDTDDCASHFRKLFPNSSQHLIVLYDTTYFHAISKFSADSYLNLVALYNGFDRSGFIV